MVKTLEITPSYLNTYEGLKMQYKNNPLYNDEDWNTMAKRGELDYYISGFLDQSDKVDYAKYSTYRPDLLNTDERLTAIANELYANKDTIVNKKESYIDTDGVEKTKTIQTTDYEYTKSLLSKVANIELEKQTKEKLQQQKNDMNKFTKFLNSTAAVGGEILAGAGNWVDDILSLSAATGEALYTLCTEGNFAKASDAFRSSYDHGDMRVFDGIFEDFREWEAKYTSLRDLDGNYTNAGKYLGSTAYSVGQALPTMALQYAGGAALKGTATAGGAALKGTATAGGAALKGTATAGGAGNWVDDISSFSDALKGAATAAFKGTATAGGAGGAALKGTATAAGGAALKGTATAAGGAALKGTATAATSARLAKAISALYWVGLGSGNFKEFSAKMPTVPTWMILLNASTKTAAEASITSFMSKAFGGSTLDSLMFKHTNTTAIGTGAEAYINKVASDFAKEGTEELLQEYSGYIIDRYFALNKDFGYQFSNLTEWNLQTMTDAYVLGGLSTIGANVASLVKNGVFKADYKRDIDIKKKGVNVFGAWSYSQNINNMLESANKLLTDSSLNNNEKQQIAGQMYASLRTISSFYGEIGEKRFNNAYQMLNMFETFDQRFSQEMYINKDLDGAFALNKYYSNLASKVATTALRYFGDMKKEFSATDTTKLANAKLSNYVDSKTEKDKDLSIANIEGKHIKDILASTDTKNIIVTENGEKAVKIDDTIIAPKNYIANASPNQLAEQIVEDTLVENFTNVPELKPFFAELSKTYKNVYGKDGTFEDVAREFLFGDKLFYKNCVYGATADTINIFTQLDKLLSTVKSNKVSDAIYKQKIRDVFINQIPILVRFMVDCQVVPEYMFDTVSTFNDNKAIALIEAAKNNRYSKELANRVRGNWSWYNTKNKDDVAALTIRLNNSSFTESEKANILKGLQSETNQVREAALKTLSKQYENMYSKFNGIIYPELSLEKGNTLTNVMYYSFLAENSINMQIVNSLPIADFNKVAKDFKIFTNNNFILVKSKTTGKVTVEEGTSFDKIDYGKLLQANKSAKSVDNMYLPIVRNNYQTVLSKFVVGNALYAKSIDVNLLITRPSFLNETTKKDIVKFAKEEMNIDNATINPYITFKYMNRTLLRDTGSMGVVVDKNNNFVLVDTVKALYALKPEYRDGKKILDLFNAKKKIKASTIFDDKFLSGRNKELTINFTEFTKYKKVLDAQGKETIESVADTGTGGEYLSESNTININKNISFENTNLLELRFTLLHEFIHAIQDSNNFVNGFSKEIFSAFESGRLVNDYNEVIKQFENHGFFADKGKKLSIDEKMRIIDSFVYYSTYETMANGLLLNEVNNYYPTVITNEPGRTVITTFWGYKIYLNKVDITKSAIRESETFKTDKVRRDDLANIYQNNIQIFANSIDRNTYDYKILSKFNNRDNKLYNKLKNDLANIVVDEAYDMELLTALYASGFKISVDKSDADEFEFTFTNINKENQELMLSYLKSVMYRDDLTNDEFAKLRLPYVRISNADINNVYGIYLGYDYSGTIFSVDDLYYLTAEGAVSKIATGTILVSDIIKNGVVTQNSSLYKSADSGNTLALVRFDEQMLNKETTYALDTSNTNVIASHQELDEVTDKELYEAYIAKRNLTPEEEAEFNKRVIDVLPLFISTLQSRYKKPLTLQDKNKLTEEATVMAKNFVKAEINKNQFAKNPNLEVPNGTVPGDKKVEKDTTKLGTRRFVSQKDAKGTNLEYWFKNKKASQQVFIDPEVQIFVVEVDPSQVNQWIWNKIGGDEKATLNKQLLYQAIRESDDLGGTGEALNQYTFDLINKNFFKNPAIKTVEELNTLTYARAEEIYATFVVLDEANIQGLEESYYIKNGKNKQINLDKLYEEIDKIANDSDFEDDIKNTMVHYQYYRGKYPLDIDYNNLKLLFMKLFDGSIKSAFDATYMARWIEVHKLMTPGKKATTSFEKSTGDNITLGDTISDKENQFEAIENDVVESIGIDSFNEKINKILLYSLEKGIIEATDEETVLEYRKILVKKFTENEEKLNKVYFKLFGEEYSPYKVEEKLSKAELEGDTETTAKKEVSVQSKVKNIKFTVNKIFNSKGITLATKKKIATAYPDLFTPEGRLNQDAYSTYQYGTYKRAYRDIEAITKLQSDIKVIWEDEKLGKYGNKTEQKAFKQMQNTIERLGKKVETLTTSNQKLKEKLIKAKSVVLPNSGVELFVDTDMEVPDVLKFILDTSFTKTRESRNKAWDYLSDFRSELNEGDKNLVIFEAKNFIRDNADKLLALTQSEVDDIIYYFRHSEIIGQATINNLDISKYMSFKKLLLGYFAREAKFGNFALTNDQMSYIEQELNFSGTLAGQQLSIHKIVMDMVKPEREIISMYLGNEIGGDEEVWEPYVNNLINAVHSKDIKQIVESKKRLEAKVVEMLRPKYKNNADLIFDKAWKLERMFMLSSPGTMIRNQVSDVLVSSSNSLSEVTNKLLKKHITGQYELTDKFNYNQKAVLDNKTAKFIKTNLEDSGLYAMTTNSLSKYDIDKLDAKKAGPAQTIATMIVKSIKTNVLNTHIFGSNDNKAVSGLNKLSVLVSKAMSDDPWIKRRTYTIFGKLLIENKVDIDQGFTNDVIKYYVDAYTLAASEYMHKTNFLTKLDRNIKNLGSGTYFMWKQFMPFASASWNWFVEATKFTPVGLIQSIVEYANLEKTIERNEKLEAEGETMASSRFTEYITKRNIGKGIIGSIGLLAGMLLGGTGNAGIDDDDKTLKIKVGKNFSIDISDIFGSSGILMGIAIGNQIYNKDSALDALVTVLDTFFLDSTFSDMFNTFRYSDTFAEWLIAQPLKVMSSLVPNFVKWFNGLLYTHDIRYSTGIQGQFERLAVQSIPGLAYSLPTKTDIYTGEIQNQQGGFVGWLDKFISKTTPLKIEKYNVSELEKTAVSLGVNKIELTGSFTINEENVKLNSSQKSVLNQLYGQLNKKALSDLLNNKVAYTVEDKNGKRVTLKYKKMTDKEKATVIKRIMSDNSSYAKIFVLTSANKYKYYTSEEEYKLLKSLGISKNVYVSADKKNGFVKISQPDKG